MDQQLKEKWVSALRSGEYQQTDGHLKVSGLLRGQSEDKISMCCLGVLCDVAGLEWFTDNGGMTFYPEDNRSGEGELYTPLRERFGLSEDAHGTLIGLNDTEGANFHEIADWIEENL